MDESTLHQEFSVMEVSQGYFGYLNIQLRSLGMQSYLTRWGRGRGAQVLHFKTITGDFRCAS